MPARRKSKRLTMRSAKLRVRERERERERGWEMEEKRFVNESFSSMQLAKKYHPDRNKGDTNTAKKFTKIGEAYEVSFL